MNRTFSAAPAVRVLLAASMLALATPSIAAPPAAAAPPAIGPAAPAFELSAFKRTAPPLVAAYERLTDPKSSPKALQIAAHAVDAWIASKASTADSHSVATAHWITGRLALRLGHRAQARKQLATLQRRGSSLADPLAIEIAAGAEATTQDWQALLAVSGHAPSFESACRKGTELLARGGDGKAAVDALQETLLQPIPTWRRRRLMKLEADLLEQVGQKEAANQARARMWWRFGGENRAPSATENWARRVFQATRSRTIAALTKELGTSDAKKTLSPDLRKLLLAMLRTHQKAEKVEASAEILKRVQALETSEGDVALRPYLLWASAVGLRTVDRDLEAAAAYQTLAREYPGHPMVDEARREAAWLLLRRGLPTDALALHDTLADSGRWGSTNRDGLWHSGIQRFLMGDYRAAMERFEPLVARYGGQLEGYGLTWAERGTYWRARALEALGKHSQAASAFEAVARAFPMSWYGTLARGRVQQMALDGRIPAFAPTGALLAARGKPLKHGPRKVIVAQRPALDRAVALYRLGRLGAAKKALESLAKARELYDSGRALLAEVLRRQGDMEGASRHLLHRGSWAAAPEGIDAKWLREQFPMPYRKHVQRAAKSNRYETALITGIIHVESRFSPGVTSGAGAIGLTQLMTRTARSVSRILLGRSLKKRQLYNPKINLEIGSRFLRELYEHFGRNPALAAAAYNAGHGAVRGWVKRRGHLPTDLWVELIPYDQTRNYVRRVVTMGEMYRRLHDLPGGRVAVPENLPVALGPFFEEKGSNTPRRLRAWGKGTISTGFKKAGGKSIRKGRKKISRRKVKRSRRGHSKKARSKKARSKRRR